MFSDPLKLGQHKKYIGNIREWVWFCFFAENAVAVVLAGSDVDHFCSNIPQAFYCSLNQNYCYLLNSS